MNSFILAADQIEYHRGWGGVLALILAGIACFMITTIHKRWQATKGAEGKALFSSDVTLALEGGKAQVSDTVDTSAALSRQRSAAEGDDLDKLVEQALEDNKKTKHIVNAAILQSGKSPRTVLRRLKRLREARKMNHQEAN